MLMLPFNVQMQHIFILLDLKFEKHITTCIYIYLYNICYNMFSNSPCVIVCHFGVWIIWMLFHAFLPRDQRLGLFLHSLLQRSHELH